MRDMLDLITSDKSRAARQRLQDFERELDGMKERLREISEHRDSITSTNVTLRLAAVEKALTQEPIDVAEANKALRGAVRKLIMRPQETAMDILWHHADEPQKIFFYTSRSRLFEREDGLVYRPDNNDSET